MRPITHFSGDPLLALEAHVVIDMLRKKEVFPSELVEISLKRIEQVEPDVNAMPTVCADRSREFVRRYRKQIDARVESVGYLGGIPIGIKDLTEVAGVTTTFGTLGMADYVPEYSDFLVERLEMHGGVVMGKTNTPEMGAGGNTFNAVFGKTRNPWNTAHNAGGSSGGAAVSLATGEVWLSHGSDLAGSLRTPAAYCGVVGLRPSPGRAGGGPASIAFNTEGVQGPMARSVTDCALFLDAMSGFDPRIPISLEAPTTPFLQAIQETSAEIKIAYSPTLNDFAPLEPAIDKVLRNALSQIEKSGAIVEEACPDLPNLNESYRVLRAMLWAAGPGSAPESIQQHYKTTLRDNIQYGHDLKIEQVYRTERNRTVLFQNMRTFLDKFDVLACPTVGLTSGAVEEEYPRELNGKPLEDYLDWLRFSFLATTTTLPALTMPVGFDDQGIPVGIQLIGPPRGEARLLTVARQVEQVLNLGCTPIDPIVNH